MRTLCCCIFLSLSLFSVSASDPAVPGPSLCPGHLRSRSPRSRTLPCRRGRPFAAPRSRLGFRPAFPAKTRLATASATASFHPAFATRRVLLARIATFFLQRMLCSISKFPILRKRENLTFFTSSSSCRWPCPLCRGSLRGARRWSASSRWEAATSVCPPSSRRRSARARCRS